MLFKIVEELINYEKTEEKLTSFIMKENWIFLKLVYRKYFSYCRNGICSNKKFEHILLIVVQKYSIVFETWELYGMRLTLTGCFL